MLNIIRQETYDEENLTHENLRQGHQVNFCTNSYEIFVPTLIKFSTLDAYFCLKPSFFLFSQHIIQYHIVNCLNIKFQFLE